MCLKIVCRTVDQPKTETHYINLSLGIPRKCLNESSCRAVFKNIAGGAQVLLGVNPVNPYKDVTG